MTAVQQLTLKRSPPDLLIHAFPLFDETGSGRISCEDLTKVAERLGETASKEELQAMIDEFDRDQDGFISKDEFLYIMQQVH